MDFQHEPTLRRYFGVDPANGEMVWVVHADGSIAGISHRVRVSKCEAEVALLVRSDTKGRGIGKQLLQDAIIRSNRDGLTILSGFVLRENREMLGLARSAGFEAKESFGLNIRLELALTTT